MSLPVLLLPGGSVNAGYFAGLRNGRPINQVSIRTFQELEEWFQKNPRRRCVAMIEPTLYLQTPGGDHYPALTKVMEYLSKKRNCRCFFIEHRPPTHDTVAPILARYPAAGFISLQPREIEREASEKLGLHY